MSELKAFLSFIDSTLSKAQCPQGEHPHRGIRGCHPVTQVHVDPEIRKLPGHIVEENARMPSVNVAKLKENIDELIDKMRDRRVAFNNPGQPGHRVLDMKRRLEQRGHLSDADWRWLRNQFKKYIGWRHQSVLNPPADTLQRQPRNQQAQPAAPQQPQNGQKDAGLELDANGKVAKTAENIKVLRGTFRKVLINMRNKNVQRFPMGMGDFPINAVKNWINALERSPDHLAVDICDRGKNILEHAQKAGLLDADAFKVKAEADEENETLKCLEDIINKNAAPPAKRNHIQGLIAWQKGGGAWTPAQANAAKAFCRDYGALQAAQVPAQPQAPTQPKAKNTKEKIIDDLRNLAQILQTGGDRQKEQDKQLAERYIRAFEQNGDLEAGRWDRAKRAIEKYQDLINPHRKAIKALEDVVFPNATTTDLQIAQLLKDRFERHGELTPGQHAVIQQLVDYYTEQKRIREEEKKKQLAEKWKNADYKSKPPALFSDEDAAALIALWDAANVKEFKNIGQVKGAKAGIMGGATFKYDFIDGTSAVFKQVGERDGHGAVSAYKVAKVLGFKHFVPTVEKVDLGQGAGHAMFWVEGGELAGDTQDYRDIVNNNPQMLEDWFQINIVDCMLGNADRHAWNWKIVNDRLYPIDNDWMFHNHSGIDNWEYRNGGNRNPASWIAKKYPRDLVEREIDNLQRNRQAIINELQPHMRFVRNTQDMDTRIDETIKVLQRFLI